MRAVVTGGAGFLGSHLIDRLVREGFGVVAVDNLVTGAWENLGHHESGVTRVEQDACESLQVEGEVDWVFHFASPASPVDFVRVPLEVLRAGSFATQSAIELALAKGARFFLASTSEVYGDPQVSPQRESYRGNVSPTGIRSVYDEAKRFAEAMTMAYHRHRGLDSRIVRLFNTYGPRMRLDDGRVVPNFIGQALRGESLSIYGDGTQTRSFAYVDDIIEGVWRLTQSRYHEPVNMGSDEEHTILEFAAIVHEVCESNMPLRFLPAAEDDPRQRRPDLILNRSLLNGWSTRVSLRDGLERTATYFRSRV